MTKRLLVPTLGLSMLLAIVPSIGNAAGEGWYVVSFEGRIRGVDRALLEQAGARSLFYRHPDSYLALLDDDEAATVEAGDGVARARPLAPAEKITARAGLLSVIAVADDVVVERIAGIAAVVRAHLATADRALLEMVVRADEAAVRAIARDPAVLTIGRAATGIELLEEATAQVLAGNVVSGRPVPGYRAFLDALGLGGAGITIAIADSGIDDSHPDLAGRVAARTDFTPLPDHRDSDGHGTHVAGIAGGSGTGLPLATDPDGLAYGMGVAPDVTFVDVGVLGILEETIGIDELPPFEHATSYAVRNGASAWNASWGSGEGPRAGYVSSSATLDALVRDADWSTPGLQPLIMVFAAGNDGSAGMGAPAEAKNLITVASSRAARAGNIETISGFSSRGPTVDGRVGPTVAAPGEQVVSTRSMPISVLCNTPPRDRVPMAGFYGLCSGTSMAAPHVTGAVAILSQWWRARHGVLPSPAVARALLVNSAYDMGPADIPNGAEGWGRVDLGALLDPSLARIEHDQTLAFDEPGETITLTVAPVDTSRPLKITIAWTDPAGAPNAPVALVNDLDLEVVGSDAATYLGNVFAGGWSITGGTPDRRETLENVFIAQPDGTYTIRISAANLPGDGIPSAGDATDQDVALVITNAVVV